MAPRKKKETPVVQEETPAPHPYDPGGIGANNHARRKMYSPVNPRLGQPTAEQGWIPIYKARGGA